MNREELLRQGKPILFNTEMVRAILDNRKTVTRRAIKPHYKEDEGGFQVCTNKATGERWVEKMDWDGGSFDSPRYVKPPYQRGDILYVRETWAETANYATSPPNNMFIYKADYPKFPDCAKWHPSIHMPKKAARIFLKVVEVRSERLQDITSSGAIGEGIPWEDVTPVVPAMPNVPWVDMDQIIADEQEIQERDLIKDSFGRLWDSTIEKKLLPVYGWKANPWVWVIEFEREEETL